MKNLALTLAIIIPLLFAPAVLAKAGPGNAAAMDQAAPEKQKSNQKEDADHQAKAPDTGLEAPGHKGDKKQADNEARKLRIKKVERLRGKKVKSWQVLNH
jgi:hemolysin activation/secretion protein